MKRTLVRILLFLLAAAAGWGTAELLQRSETGRELLARFLGSEAAIRAETNLRHASANEVVRNEDVDRELQVLRHQFGADEQFEQALNASGLSLGELREELSANLHARGWIEKQIAGQTSVTREEARDYYARNRGQFAQPQRFRARHLFVAAPDGVPADVMTAKLRALEGLSMRMLGGEKFEQLVAEASEDEASKARGGDLGYFSELRMPPEFMEELKKLAIGQTSGPIRSHLGFHLVQLTEIKPPRELTPDDARAEITLAIANQKRALAVASLTERLGTSEFEKR